MNFNDKILRYSLIYCINNSRHKNNTNLKEYVLKEMSNKDLLALYWLDKDFLQEDKKLVNVPSWATTPFYIIAGGSLSRAVGAALRKGQITKRLGGRIPATADTIAGASIAFGATVLANSVFWFYKRATDECNKKCKQTIVKGKNYQAQFSVCFHHCKVVSISNLIQKLRSQRSLCNQTRYPEKCFENLNSQIVRYQAQLEKEAYRLKVSKEILYKRQRKVPAVLSSKPTIEKK